MKKDKVPQDEGNLLKKSIKDLCYATDEKGKYTTVLSTGWDVKTVVQNESMELIQERVEEARKKIIEGKLSPIAYYMEFNKMDICVLASYVKIWSWSVKRHFKPSSFNKLKEKTLKKYAEVFNITVEELKNIDKYREKE